MDKKWRNLLVIIVIIAVLIAGYFYFSQNPISLPVVEAKSIDFGYEEILGLFEKNDANIENVQTLNMVYSDENGNVIWVENKSNLNKVKSDLTSFKSNLGAYSSEDRGELEELATIYIRAIDFAFLSEERLNTIMSVIKGNKVTCSNLAPLSDINNASNWNYNDKYNLAAEVDDFAYNYDPYSEILSIDLDKEYAYLTSVHDFIDNTINSCEGSN